jgi:predicted lactoylglutathione lyase
MWEINKTVSTYKSAQFKFEPAVACFGLRAIFETAKYNIKKSRIEKVIQKIKEIHEKGACVVILGNVKNNICPLISDLESKSGVPIFGMLSNKFNCFSMPHTNLWKLISHYNPHMCQQKSIFISGSAYEAQFANNIKIHLIYHNLFFGFKKAQVKYPSGENRMIISNYNKSAQDIQDIIEKYTNIQTTWITGLSCSGKSYVADKLDGKEKSIEWLVNNCEFFKKTNTPQIIWLDVPSDVLYMLHCLQIQISTNTSLIRMTKGEFAKKIQDEQKSAQNIIGFTCKPIRVKVNVEEIFYDY